MGVGEEYAPRCQPVQVRRVYAPASTHAIDPVVEVIHGNEEHIWFFCGPGSLKGHLQPEHCKEGRQGFAKKQAWDTHGTLGSGMNYCFLAFFLGTSSACRGFNTHSFFTKS